MPTFDIPLGLKGLLVLGDSLDPYSFNKYSISVFGIFFSKSV